MLPAPECIFRPHRDKTSAWEDAAVTAARWATEQLWEVEGHESSVEWDTRGTWDKTLVSNPSSVLAISPQPPPA